MALQFLRGLFRCQGCERRQQEIDLLWRELHAAQAALADQRKESDARLEAMAKDCLDRVMARSYAEYEVGQASRQPDKPKHRSDEDEFLIEKSRQFLLQSELRQAEVAET